MILAGMSAGGKRIQPLDAMRQTLLHQKIQRAIRNRGLVAKAFGRQPVKDVVSAQCAVVLQQDFKHPPPDRCQPRAASVADRLGPRQSVACTMGVIMHRKGQIGRRTARAVCRIMRVNHLRG